LALYGGEFYTLAALLLQKNSPVPIMWFDGPPRWCGIGVMEKILSRRELINSPFV